MSNQHDQCTLWYNLWFDWYFATSNYSLINSDHKSIDGLHGYSHKAKHLCGRKHILYRNSLLLTQEITTLIYCLISGDMSVNTLRPRQDGRHFPDDIFKCIFLNENTRILIKISLMFVPKDSIDNIPTLVQIMAWRRPGDKPLSEPIMVSLLTHICVTRPQWVKGDSL